MAKLQINGRILVKGETIGVPSRNGSTFYKRELVLDASHYDPYTGQKYENFPKFEFTGNKISELDKFSVGDMVTVSFFLSGRCVEKDGKTNFYTSVVGYAVEVFLPQRNVSQQQTSADFTQPVERVSQQSYSSATSMSNDATDGGSDDLPF